MLIAMAILLQIFAALKVHIKSEFESSVHEKLYKEISVKNWSKSNLPSHFQPRRSRLASCPLREVMASLLRMLPLNHPPIYHSFAPK